MKYTKSIIFILMVSFIFSCKKKDDDNSTSVVTPAPTITAVPATFTQKVMIEENTGNWCGWCVLGAEGIKKADETFPGRVNAVALHGGGQDAMTVPEYNTMLTFANVSGVPHYQLNRGSGGGFPGSFSSAVSGALNQVAQSGLAIDATKSSGTSVSFDVHAGFNTTLTGDYRLMVYLVEDAVTGTGSGYNQSNYVSNDPNYTTSAYYSLPATITNYSHKHVARKLLSASLSGGDQIPAANVAAGKSYVKTYTFTIPAASGWNPANIRVVAGIMKYSPNCSLQKIINSQSTLLGSLKNWD